MTYKIRFMAREDLPQVFKIDKEAFPTQWPPTNYRSEIQNRLAHYVVVYLEGKGEEPEPVIHPAKRGLFSGFKRLFGSDKSSVMSTPDIIIGFAGCWIMADEIHVTEIAVRGDYRNRGIGHLLLISMIELGMKYKANCATLEVRLSNTSAQALYEKFGFEKVGLRKAYYSDNKEDAIIMTTPNIYLPAYKTKLNMLKQELMRKWGISEVPLVEGRDATMK